jgi:D-alanine-D-alanine ligase-like ATP-grasp enzyme
MIVRCALFGVFHLLVGSKHCELAMDKHISKLLAQAEGIPIAKSCLVRCDAMADYQTQLLFR